MSGIESVDFGEILSEKYLAYAMSTITSRSLPDVRDGLKPVHRRLLYAMLQLKLDPKNAFKKCARVVGDVIGKYHPHGDIAVYETLVRLAQSFSLRYPLVDGQGNFGSIDGDNAAAMRYTESRLTDLAMMLLSDLDKDTVDFRNTYDDSDVEPSVLPASFPNILVNGSEGIAVGMATSIPSHNLYELCEAMLLLIDNPNATVSDLMHCVKGPDFPTGGIIIDNEDTIRSIYETGRGSIRLRAKWHKEEMSHGMYEIIVTELPFQVPKAKLIEHIASLFKDKKIPLVNNIRDESAEDIRIVIEPRNRSCDPHVVMESLFKQCNLEVRFACNMNVIDSKGMPRVMSIKEILNEFLLYRFQVVVRRSRFLLANVNRRLEILDGMRIVYLNLDEVIAIVRDEDDPKSVLIVRFKLTELQAEYILNIRLRSLRKIEEIAINKEYDNLLLERSYLESLISDESVCWKCIKDDIANIQTIYHYNSAVGARRTKFDFVSPQDIVIDHAAFIEKEQITVICSKLGWIRAVKGTVNDISTLKFKEGDDYKLSLSAYTTDTLIISTIYGKFYTILADNLSKVKGHGDSINVLFDLIQGDQVLNVMIYNKNDKILLVANNGKGFVANSDDVIAQTKNGKQIMVINDDNSCIFCNRVDNDMIAMIGSNRKLLIFSIDEIPHLKKGQGVTLQKYTSGFVSDIQLFDKSKGFLWRSARGDKTEMNIAPWLGKRGGSGKIPPFGFSKNNKFIVN